MPYFFDGVDTPVDDALLWERLAEILRMVRADLIGVHFETEQEAIDKTYRKSLDPKDMRFDSFGVARYRETDDRDNLFYFHELALKTLPNAEAGIRNRRLTPNSLMIGRSCCLVMVS